MDGIVSYKSDQQVAQIVDHGRIDNAQLRLKSCLGEPGKIAMHRRPVGSRGHVSTSNNRYPSTLTLVIPICLSQAVFVPSCQQVPFFTRINGKSGMSQAATNG